MGEEQQGKTFCVKGSLHCNTLSTDGHHQCVWLHRQTAARAAADLGVSLCATPGSAGDTPSGGDAREPQQQMAADLAARRACGRLLGW